jgi:hypothetical protein
MQQPVTVAEWKSVILDAYDGHMNIHHPRAAVGAAVDRLPHDLLYCGPCLQLEAYERKVCGQA